MYKHREGVTFRKLDYGDLSLLMSLKEESWWGTHRVPVISSLDQERWYENIPSDQLFMIGVWNGERLGVAVYTEIDCVSRSLMISGSILKVHRNPQTVRACFCGGLDFAFEMLNMRRIGAEVLASNYPSLKVELQELGFTVEGLKRQAVYKCGMYIDSYVLGILREEWELQERIQQYQGSCNLNFDRRLAERLVNRSSELVHHTG